MQTDVNRQIENELNPFLLPYLSNMDLTVSDGIFFYKTK